MTKYRIVFMGTPGFAVPSLEALHEGPDDVVAVVTQPDRPAGRGQKMTVSPVKQAALELGLPVLQPERIRGERGAEFRGRLRDLAPDLVVVAAFGMILPRELLELPRHGCVNVHASLLPRWRGAGPIQWAIAAGDEKTGISIMMMEEGLDTGPVLLRRETPIQELDTGGSLHDRLAALGATALVEALGLMRGGSAEAKPQDDERATYAPMLTREDGRLDFSLPARELELRVRAMQPWPGAFASLGGRLLKVHRAAVATKGGEGAGPGTIITAGAGGIDVATGDGVLRLLEVQPEGKRRMSVESFVAGRGELMGQRFV